MDISKDGTRIEDFIGSLANNPMEMRNRIAMEIKNPYIYADFISKKPSDEGAFNSIINAAYAANLITKSDRDYFINEMGAPDDESGEIIR